MSELLTAFTVIVCLLAPMMVSYHVVPAIYKVFKNKSK